MAAISFAENRPAEFIGVRDKDSVAKVFRAAISLREFARVDFCFCL